MGHYAKISLQEYDRLRNAEQALKEVLNGDGVIEYLFNSELYYVQPKDDFIKQITEKLKKSEDKADENQIEIMTLKNFIFDLESRINKSRFKLFGYSLIKSKK